MAKSKLFQLTLNEIKVVENGRPGKKDAQNVILVNLHWPRPRIDERSAVKIVRLEDNKPMKFKKSRFSEKTVFKEVVQKPFSISVEITERQSPSAIQSFIADTIGTLISTAWAAPSKEEVARRLIRTGTISAFNRVKANERVQTIAFGEVEIDPIKGKKGKLKIPLTTLDNITNINRTNKKKRKTLLKAGEKNGYIILNYNISAD